MPTISDSSGIDADEEAAAAATSKAPGTGKDAMAGRGTSEHEEGDPGGADCPSPPGSPLGPSINDVNLCTSLKGKRLTSSPKECTDHKPL
ncbi:unnamed protein product [Lampetra planeri]